MFKAMSGSYRSSLSHPFQGTSMKRLALLFASLALSTLPIGCGEQAAPPAGTPGTGPYTGPSTAGVAQKNREQMFRNLDQAAAKATKRAR
jgi:hypothetical protein